MKILDEKFLSKYRNAESPLSNIGEFVYLRTYSRYLNDKNRRENWFETVLRTTEYNINLGIDFKKKNNLEVNMEEERKEAKRLFDNLFNLRTFTSGRTLYMGGTEIVKEYPLSNFNCCFTLIKKFHDFVDVFYLLMLGAGVGIRIDKDFINEMPKVRKTSIINRYESNVRESLNKEDIENTILIINANNHKKAVIKVGDSKEGWCNALDIYFELITLPKYKHIEAITIDYSFVRPAGERLKRFGGRASGYGSLERMFEKISHVINSTKNGILKTIDVLDIANIISENVVSGGVRRSAMMVICDEEDEEVIHAKKDLYKVVNGKWIENINISHRKMSNNSVLYKEKPSLEKIKEMLNSIKINGEPGFINGIEAKRRKDSFKGCNPCGEILLQSHECCNLTTNNLVSFVDDENKLHIDELKEVLKNYLQE